MLSQKSMVADGVPVLATALAAASSSSWPSSEYITIKINKKEDTQSAPIIIKPTLLLHYLENPLQHPSLHASVVYKPYDQRAFS